MQRSLSMKTSFFCTLRPQSVPTYHVVSGEKVRLDASFPRALAQVDEELQWWDQKIVNKVKARLLRLKQYIMRRRKLLLEPKVEYVSVNKRQEDKLLRREEKAEAAARLELEVEKELLERLRKGTYDSVMNCSREAFERVLDQEEDRAEFDALEDEEDEEFPEFVMDEEDEDEEEEPIKTTAGLRPSGRRPVRRQRLVIEEEVEHEQQQKRSRLDDLDW
ncbi:hypothetical protein C4B63_293g10 [Trypanosoma cruzi]|uniref:Protein MAK16 homolog n=1 Tax=Trypanosoma cruzi TaxID=5693 RepID=A0A2V2UID2_TRYCR|nr:hypothetical protein C4B63_293g10 [Trypanosoma cruzi]